MGELKPLSSSETALCWYAVDYAEGEPKTEQLAVKFKLVETKSDFKAVFEAAQEEMRQRNQGVVNVNEDCQEEVGNPNTNQSSRESQTAIHRATEDVDRQNEEYDDEEDDDNEDDDEDSDSSNMFERQCTLLEREENVETSLGQVDLRILYDDDVFGARITAYSEGTDGNGAEVCNHLIAMQTTLDTSTPTGGNGTFRCSWSALDFSVDPPKYRSFVAIFDSTDTFQEFKDTFYEGKELAEQSEILEQPEATADQSQDGIF